MSDHEACVFTKGMLRRLKALEEQQANDEGEKDRVDFLYTRLNDLETLYGQLTERVQRLEADWIDVYGGGVHGSRTMNCSQKSETADESEQHVSSLAERVAKAMCDLYDPPPYWSFHGDNARAAIREVADALDMYWKHREGGVGSLSAQWLRDQLEQKNETPESD